MLLPPARPRKNWSIAAACAEDGGYGAFGQFLIYAEVAADLTPGQTCSNRLRLTALAGWVGALPEVTDWFVDFDTVIDKLSECTDDRQLEHLFALISLLSGVELDARFTDARVQDAMCAYRARYVALHNAAAARAAAKATHRAVVQAVAAEQRIARLATLRPRKPAARD